MKEVKELTEYERGFIEGFLDADGCIGLYKQMYDYGRGWTIRLTLTFSNNSLEILEKIYDILGESGSIVKRVNKGVFNYDLKYRHNAMRRILPQLKLIIKEHRRKTALAILDRLGKKVVTSEGELEMLIEEFFHS